MREAAGYLQGRHDFTSFRASGCGAKHPVREITQLDISGADTINFMTFNLPIPVIKITIRANAFLRHMVRNIVGTLVEVGQKKHNPERVKDILTARDRTTAGVNAPACGLFLENVEY